MGTYMIRRFTLANFDFELGTTKCWSERSSADVTECECWMSHLPRRHDALSQTRFAVDDTAPVKRMIAEPRRALHEKLDEREE